MGSMGIEGEVMMGSRGRCREVGLLATNVGTKARVFGLEGAWEAIYFHIIL